MEMKNMLLPRGKLELMVIEVVSDSSCYPYGLNICLENEAIDKLGIAEMPEVGEEVMIIAKAKVESCSMNEMAGGRKNRTISLQITDMNISEAEEEKDIAKELYGGK